MSQAHRVAFIGTGGRSVPYASHFRESGAIDIVGLADPARQNRIAMKQRAQLPGQPAEYDHWQDMLAELGDSLDGVVIATPNHLHAEQAIACLERGLPIALEKPIASNLGDCERIVDCVSANAGRTLVGFVLRSTPFYGKIKELIASGAIGKVVSVQADELVGWLVTSLMLRNPWRRHRATSGGAMLEKCCHDMDILQWLIGSRPVAVSSFGGNLLVNENPLLPDECPGCPQEGTCKYYCEPVGAAHEDAGEAVLHQFLSDAHRCIYNIDRDVLDTQTVSLLYENGAVANFLMNFHAAGPRAGRSILLVGTRGMIWGTLHDLKISHFDNASGETQVYDTKGDDSGHGGGDRTHTMELKRMMDEPAYRPAQDAYAGYLSAVTCFAADRSVEESRQVRFRYTSAGKCELV